MFPCLTFIDIDTTSTTAFPAVTATASPSAPQGMLSYMWWIIPEGYVSFLHGQGCLLCPVNCQLVRYQLVILRGTIQCALAVNQSMSYAACTRHTNLACFFIFIAHLINYNRAWQKIHGNRFHMDSFVSSVWFRFWSGNRYGKCTKVLKCV